MENRILIADDEEDIRWILETSLKKSGFEVECAENGEDAVRKACEEAYSLILLDINMPDMNGFEVLTQLRNREVDCAHNIHHRAEHRQQRHRFNAARRL